MPTNLQSPLDRHIVSFMAKLTGENNKPKRPGFAEALVRDFAKQLSDFCEIHAYDRGRPCHVSAGP